MCRVQRAFCSPFSDNVPHELHRRSLGHIPRNKGNILDYRRLLDYSSLLDHSSELLDYYSSSLTSITRKHAQEMEEHQEGKSNEREPMHARSLHFYLQRWVHRGEARITSGG